MSPSHSAIAFVLILFIAIMVSFIFERVRSKEEDTDDD